MGLGLCADVLRELKLVSARQRSAVFAELGRYLLAGES